MTRFNQAEVKRLSLMRLFCRLSEVGLAEACMWLNLLQMFRYLTCAVREGRGRAKSVTDFCFTIVITDVLYIPDRNDICKTFDRLAQHVRSNLLEL